MSAPSTSPPMRLFEGILRFARTGGGDVNTLHGDLAGAFRLRIGDYRVLFSSRKAPCASSVSDIALKLTGEAQGKSVFVRLVACHRHGDLSNRAACASKGPEPIDSFYTIFKWCQ